MCLSAFLCRPEPLCLPAIADSHLALGLRKASNIVHSRQALYLRYTGSMCTCISCENMSEIYRVYMSK